MKRTVIALALIALATAGLVAETSAYYPIRVDVVQVFAHSDGYRVIYRKGTSDVAEAYLPIKWFVPGGKAELVRGNDPSFPYLVAFYKEGKFDHLRLYVKDSLKDPMWSVLPPSEGVGKFGSEDLKLLF